MSTEKETKHQTLHCSICKNWLKLEFKYFDRTVNGIHIVIPSMPLLVCYSCEATYEPDWTKLFIQWIVEESKKKNTKLFKGERKVEAENFRYDFCKDVNFTYDASDCKFIPGLQSPFTKEGYFTPVFFNRKVLHKYLSFDEYRVNIAGNTYGMIYFQDGNYLPYGINMVGKLFCWLGDIDENVPKNEQHYLLSENIRSDHDVASEFYAATREAKFADYSNENMLLHSRFSFEQYWNQKYTTKIFRYDKDIYEILEDLIRPVNWNKKGVIHVFNSLNKVCIESLYRNSIIKAIKSYEPNFDGKKLEALKLMEKLISLNDPDADASEIMNPFFVLYDFRLVLVHDYTESEEKEKLDFYYNRLGIPVDYKNFEYLYDRLLDDLASSFSGIEATV